MKRHSIARRTCIGRLGLALGLAGTLVTGSTALADVTLPAIFGNHMVLQQKQKNKVWGKADPNEDVTVSISSGGAKDPRQPQSLSTKADGQGKWSVTLDPLDASNDSLTMTVKGKNSITFDDVLVGEVWICSGQSNMQWDVAVANDPDLELLTAKDPGIRLITVPLIGTQEPKDDFKGRWELCTPESARYFSAVGYFFGRQLRQTLGVPIGLIDDAWGGSACEAWIRRDLLEKDQKYQPLVERWEKIEKEMPEAVKSYEKALTAWKEAETKAKAAGEKPPMQPQDPRNQLNGNARLGNIYNGVLKPTIGYGIKGVVWYQGESNAGRAYQYRDLFPLMIQSWRDEWGIGDFSFYWVQLADFLPEKAEPSPSSWAELREAQTMTMSRLPNTGQAVIIDLGEAQDIHPRNKQDVARRLARWALARDYGIKIPYQSPLYKSTETKDNKITVTFDNVGGGLKPFDVPEVRGFTIAGSDQVFHKARAKVVAPNKVEVSSDDVSQPVAVRYAWADNPVCNLYGNGGLPVTPFRTDDWKGTTADAK